MRFSTYRFTLNMHTHHSQASVSVFRGDTAVRLLITLLDGDIPFNIREGCTAVLSGTKADGTKLWDRCVITGNVVQYDFNEQTTSCTGVTNCEVTLYDTDGGVLTAPKFIIVVDEREIGYTDIESSDYISPFDPDRLVAIYQAEEDRAEAEKNRQGAIDSLTERITDNDRHIEQQARNIETTEKRITNLEKGLPSERFLKDDSEAFVKYVPYNACPYALVDEVGDQVTAISVKGKNLWDSSLWVDGSTNTGITAKYLPDEDCYLINGTLSAGKSATVSVKYDKVLLPNTMYTLQGIHISGSIQNAKYATAYVGYQSTQNWLDVNLINSGSSVKSKASLDNHLIGRLWFYFSTNGSTDVVVNDYRIKIQLEKSNIATEYKPYSPSNTLTISQILNSDGFIEVEQNGSLTFVNDGDNDVPSTVIYQLKEAT